MSIQSRLEVLSQRHQELESALHKEMLHPAFDDLKVHDIKRQKLKLKDEMESLKSMDVRFS